MAQWLSFFLVKAGINSPEKIVRHIENLDEIAIDPTRIEGRLFVKRRDVSEQSWVQELQEIAVDEISLLEDVSPTIMSAVLLINQNDRIFAIPFGHGWSLVNPDAIEDNFGLKVVLNSVDKDKLKALDAKSFEGVTITHRREASKVTDVRGFGIDVENHLLAAATGAPRNNSLLGSFISGKDQLRLATEKNLDELSDLLEELIRLSADASFEQEHEWVTRLAQIREPNKIKQLETLLAEKIVAGDLDRTWLALPEPIERLGFNGFKFSESSQTPKRGASFDDLCWDAYFEFRETKSGIENTRVFSDFVHVMSGDNETAAHRWKLHNCIYCEIDFEGSTYFLNECKWYRVESDFLAKVNQEIEPLFSQTTLLPDCDGLDEKDYNIFACEKPEDQRVLLDRKLLRAFASEDAVEFCDILDRGSRMIHVKHYSGSSTLSHLFNQGLVGGTLFRTTESFRTELNGILPEAHRLQDPVARPPDDHYEIVYAIIRSGKNKSHNLPLFSKLTLREVAKLLKGQGYRVSVEIIPGTPKMKKDENAAQA